MASSHLRRHSVASSIGSLTDDLLFSGGASAPLSSFVYSAPGAGDPSFAFSDVDPPSPGQPYHAHGSSSRRSSLSRPAVAPGLVPLPSAEPSTPRLGAAAGRSRARAFSFLGVPDAYGPRHDDASPLPHSGETPFVGGAYDYALDGDAEDEVDALDDVEEDGVELREVGGSSTAGAAAARKALFRTRFQPLVAYELAWMGVSAAAVLGLTVAAVVLASVG